MLGHLTMAGGSSGADASQRLEAATEVSSSTRDSMAAISAFTPVLCSWN
jgi:hypothetical protein